VQLGHFMDVALLDEHAGIKGPGWALVVEREGRIERCAV
jgi:hypothetical protein